jgi:hypothetical protein
MNEGYVINGGCEHYCSDACLHKHVSADEFEDLHDDGDGDSYWTEWEEGDCDDDDEEEEALRVATTRDYQALAQERKRREKMVRDAAPDLLAALEHVDAYLAPEGDEEDAYNYIRAIIKGAISKAQGA